MSLVNSPFQETYAANFLRANLKGRVITPEDADYDSVRHGLNIEVVRRPALIARPVDAIDVSHVVSLARETGMELAIRGGGHSLAGFSTTDGGIALDLSQMKNLDIDVHERTAWAEAGLTAGEYSFEAASHGLATGFGDTASVGIGGLTTGGGIGYLVRKYGLTIDNLLAARVVTADGQIRHVDAETHPDLFWAIRGGGGNFGVVTSFEFRAQPLRSVTGGMVSYPIADMKTVLVGWSDYMRTAPDELNSTVVIFPGFGPQMPPQIMVLLCYGGEDEAAAKTAIQPLLELGPVQHQQVQIMPYYKMLEDAAPPPGVKAVSENGFVKTLSEDVIAALAANYGQPGTPIVQIRSLGGAVARIPCEATAFAHRD
ncbi:MAG: FAD-binding oxidoreductase, partial [Anaerolineae bacterium]|nr:FAD-binding oxidoreductase [Anaerolineae bacterium]